MNGNGKAFFKKLNKFDEKKNTTKLCSNLSQIQ